MLTNVTYMVYAGDFNNDGNLDLATSLYDINVVEVRLGNGDGTFGAPSFSGTTQGPW